MPEVKGFRPDTGEECTIRFTGNFPIKDPETDVFLASDEPGEFKPAFPGRSRQRFEVLSQQGEEILDSRPMASAVMFSDHIQPEDQIRELMKDANYRAHLRAWIAEQEGVETYDEFDYDDDVIDTDGLVSAYELAHHKETDVVRPRLFHSALDAVANAVRRGSGPLATPAAPAGSPPSEEPADPQQS